MPITDIDKHEYQHSAGLFVKVSLTHFMALISFLAPFKFMVKPEVSLYFQETERPVA